MAKRIVGLEIGPEVIHAVQVRFGNFSNKVVLEKIVDLPVTSGIDSNGRITNPDLIGQQLKNLWRTHKFATKHVALGLGGTDVFVREFSVPEMKSESLSGALAALAEGSLPMPTTELLLDFYPAKIIQTGGSNTVSGLLLAATRSSADSLVGVIQSAGLSPDSIDLVPFTLLRQLDDKRHQDQVIAIVHASAGILNIVVAKNQVPIFIRMVPLPSMKREVSVSVDENESSASPETSAPESSLLESAEEQITQESVELNTTEILTVRGDQIVSSAFQDAAIRELKETLAYYAKNHPNNPIATLLTSGTGLDNSEWLTLLGQQIWLPSESHTSSETFQGESGKKRQINVPTEYLVALSLAKGGLRG